jgi:hypothetical protein
MNAILAVLIGSPIRGWRLRRAWLLLAIVAGVEPSCDGPIPEQNVGSAPAASREHAIERTPVRSSALRSVGDDQEQRTLEIEFTNGAVYQYFGVPRGCHCWLVQQCLLWIG